MADRARAGADFRTGIRTDNKAQAIGRIIRAARPVVESLESRQMLSALPPMLIQAENFDQGGEGVAYHDLDSANRGGAYRTTEGVDIETSADAGGGYDIARMQAGEWLQYTINVAAAGTYRLDFRFYSTSDGSFHANVDGVNRTGTMAMPRANSGWRTLSSPAFDLSAGQHVVRVVVDSTASRTSLGYLNWIQLTNIPPVAPSGLTATAASSSSVALNWADNASNETGYRIERKTGSSGTYQTIALLAANARSYTDSGLAASTQYVYRVVALQGQITSDYSNEAAATTLADPVTPPTYTPTWTNIAVGTQAGQFTAEFDATPQAANMDVVMGLSNGSTTSYSGIAAIVRFNNTGTIDARNGSAYAADASVGYTSGSRYHFRIVGNISTHAYDVYVTAGTTTTKIASGYAFRTEQAGVTQLNNFASYNNSGGVTLAGLTVAAVAVAPPAAPSNLTAAAASASQITLNWTDNATDETAYKVERKTGTSGTWQTIATLAANSRTYSDSGLAASTQYVYRVAAVNGTIASAYSSEASATTAAAPTSTGVVLTPGSGFTAATAQPANVGSSTQFGYRDKVIARWDVVPYQTFSGTLNVGVVAFHNSGIDRVEFSVNGGAWTAVRQMTANPQTGVTEYWATLDASRFSRDGQIEVRAVAYPKVGAPRVLQGADVSGNGSNPLFLNVNGQGTLQSLVRYVATNGSDTTGDGSETRPFATILRAARDIQDDSGTGTADGGTVYLKAGNYQLGPYSYAVQTNTSSRWLTIAAAPGVARSNVRITGAASTDGLRTRLVHFENVTIAAPSGSTARILTNTPSLNGAFWLDKVDAIGPGSTVSATWSYGWSGQYLTDSTVSNCRDGIAGDIVRNTRVFNIGSDAFSGSYMVINSSVENIDRGDSGFHPDVFQVYPSATNVILYGIDATRNVTAQGLFVGAGCTLTDAAFVNVKIDNQDIPTVFNVFQFLGTVTNMYIKDSVFTGPSRWRTDAGFVATDVVLVNTVFTSSNPGTVPGVYWF